MAKKIFSLLLVLLFTSQLTYFFHNASLAEEQSSPTEEDTLISEEQSSPTEEDTLISEEQSPPTMVDDPIRDEDGVYEVSINLVDENGVRVTGVKKFGDNDGYIYLPENGKYYLELYATYRDGTEYDLSQSTISLTQLANDGNQLTFDPTDQSINTHQIDWYKKGFERILKVDNYQIKLKLYVYEGKLGLLNLKNPDETSYSGHVLYTINYKFQQQRLTGGHTDGEVYGGVLPIPIQGQYVNLDYVFAVISPNQLSYDQPPTANTPFINFTEYLNTDAEFYDLGEVQFQTPTLIANVYDRDINLWQNTMNFINNAYIGDDYDLNNDISFHIPNHQGQLYLAPLGVDFHNEASISVANNDGNLPINSTFDLLNDGQVDLYSPVEQIRGNLLLADGTAIPTGYNKDTNVYIRGITDSSETYQSGFGNSGDYKITGLTVGHEYWIEAYFDLGDFVDIGVSNSIPIKFTYDNTPGTHIGEDKYGNVIQYVVNSDGIIELDLNATTPVLRGQIFMGGIPVSPGLNVSIIDLETKQMIESGSSFGSTVSGWENQQNGLYQIGGIAPINGEYMIYVEDPNDTIDYTGDVFNLTFPINTTLDIHLPESNIYGNIVLASEDEAKYLNDIRRVYLNVFDEYGDFVKYGRVRSDGAFSVSQLDPGRYYAQAFVSPYSTVAEDYTSSDKHEFIVTDGDKTTFDVPLKKVTGTGSVHGPNGQPLEGIWVKIFDEQLEEVDTVKTNDQGNFYIPKLEPGAYKVKAYGAYGFTDSNYATLEVNLDSENISLQLQLTNPLITGFVQAGSGQANIDVFLFDNEKKYLTFTTTDQDGAYDLGGIEPGEYYLQAIPKEPISGYAQTGLIPVTVTDGGISVNLNLVSEDLQGFVHDPDGQAISRGWVQLYLGEEFNTSIKIERDGTFKYGDLLDGQQYTIVADGSKTKFSASEKVTVTKGDTGVVLILTNKATMKGKVNGAKKSKLKIYIYTANKEAVKVIETNMFGEFKDADLESGSYILVIPGGERPFVQEFDYDGSELDLGTINLE